MLKLQSVTGVPVDITIAVGQVHTGLAARDLVRSFCQQAPPIAPLVLVLKTFLRSLSLNDPFTGGISSYCADPAHGALPHRAASPSAHC